MPRLLKVFTILSLAFFASLFLYLLFLPSKVSISDAKNINNCSNLTSWQEVPAFEKGKPVNYPYQFQNDTTQLSFHIKNRDELVFAGSSGPFSLEGSLFLKIKSCQIALQLDVSTGFNPVTKLFLEAFANQASVDILDLFS